MLESASLNSSTDCACKHTVISVGIYDDGISVSEPGALILMVNSMENSEVHQTVAHYCSRSLAHREHTILEMYI